MVALPIQLTSFIGREDDLAQVAALLAGTRLLTLTGPGGVGKTRLALELARRVASSFRDGVQFVGLAAIADPALTASTVAAALGLRETGGAPTEQIIAAHLAEHELLLVLDNFEQIIDAATVVSGWMSACPTLKLLLTSRVPLHIAGEQEYPVSPMALPDGSASPARLQAASTAESVRLFVQRAAASRPSFQLSSDNVEAVEEICRRLDGLPLAIELAAARSKVLTPQALLVRLDHPLALLTGGTRDAPARQQTIRQAIAWSYDLLDSDEQQFFRALGAFRGGWTLEAAEAVAAPTGTRRFDVLDGLSSLVNKSLVRQLDQPDGSVRFTMLETIREFGLEQLKNGEEAEEIRRRHLNYYLALAEMAEPHSRGPSSTVWFARLDAELDNIRSALTWAEAHEPDVALQLAAALWRFWAVQGYLREGQRWLEGALAASEAAPPGVRAKALQTEGSLALAQGDFVVAVARSEECLVLARATGDRAQEAHALNGLGWAAYEQHDYRTARARFDECLAVGRALDDQWRIGLTLTHLGKVTAGEGNDTAARPLLEQGLALLRESGDTGNVAFALDALGSVMYHQREFAAAQALLQESIAIQRELREAETPRTLVLLAALAAAQGDPERAARLFGAVSGLREVSGFAIQTADEERRAAIESVRKQLTAEQVARLWSEGRAMSLDAAIAYALGPSEPTPQPEPDPAADVGLSPREIEVLKLLVAGKSNQEIAAALFISPHTVANHVASVMNKLGVDSRTAAATWAVKHGLD